MKVLIFDTETSGKSKNFKAPYTDTNAWPRLVQLAFQVYDNGKLIQSFQAIVKPVDFDIEPGAEKVHGISKKQALEIGMDRMDVLITFIKALKLVDCIVCHNTAFDTKVMGCELFRIGHPNIIKDKLQICTMLSSTNYCKIYNNWGGFKWPKLLELHKILFGREFDGAHDAMVDVEATAKCFFELLKRNVITPDGKVVKPKFSKKIEITKEEVKNLNSLSSDIKKIKSFKLKK